RFLANMGIFMGMKELIVDLGEVQSATVRDVIEKITEVTVKDLKGKVMDEKGKSTGRVRIILNGRDIVSLQKFETPIKDSDEISMFPALGAG
ncbi:MAG: MoaD/ThiS family protein, partial [Candidatus Odinarchaeia archaeon]